MEAKDDIEALEQQPSDEEALESQHHPSEESKRSENSESRNNVVDWDGPEDPQNPRNWKTGAKLFNVSLIMVLVFVTPLASSMFAPGVPQVLDEFHNHNSVIAELVVSIYILGFAVGPLIISPMSEIYGRYPVYVVCNIGFMVWTIACAVSQTITQLVIFRFFAGAFGVCPLVLGGASTSDLLRQEERGAFMSLFGLGPLLGPVIGPICGGYVSASIGWRWTFWIIVIAYGTFTLTHAVFCRETYAPILLDRKTRRLRMETGNASLVSKEDDGLPHKVRIRKAIVRPVKLLFLSPIVGLMALYVAVVYGILYLLYSTYTFVFERYYGFSSANVGLVYIGSGIGMILGLFVVGGSSDRLLKRGAAKHGGELKPEFRLIPLMFLGPLVPAGLFIYGWTVQYHEQWAVPLFGALLFGTGIISALICIQQYLVDAYTQYAASALAANNVLRSVVGGLLPLAGLSIYNALALGWGNSVAAFIAVAMLPIPVVCYLYGERIRGKDNLDL